MSGLNKSREAYLKATTKAHDLRTLLAHDDAHVLATIKKLPADQGKAVLQMWAFDRATADIQGWSDAWRKSKALSHGVVGGTFVGLFGNHIKAAVSSAAHSISSSTGLPYDASLAYHRAIDEALRLDERGLSTSGLYTGIATQIALPLLSLGTAATVSQTATFTALQGPIFLVPAAATRIGNIARFGAVDAAAYGTANYAIHDGNHYRTVDGMVDGGFYGMLIGTIIPKHVRSAVSAAGAKGLCTVDEAAQVIVPKAPTSSPPHVHK